MTSLRWIDKQIEMRNDRLHWQETLREKKSDAGRGIWTLDHLTHSDLSIQLTSLPYRSVAILWFNAIVCHNSELLIFLHKYNSTLHSRCKNKYYIPHIEFSERFSDNWCDLSHSYCRISHLVFSFMVLKNPLAVTNTSWMITCTSLFLKE